MNNKLILLYEKILSQTKANKLEWEETGNDGFRTNIGDFSIFLFKTSNQYYHLQSYDKSIESIGDAIMHKVSDKNVPDLKVLYRLITEQVYKTDEKLDTILDELDKL